MSDEAIPGCSSPESMLIQSDASELTSIHVSPSECPCSSLSNRGVHDRFWLRNISAWYAHLWGCLGRNTEDCWDSYFLATIARIDSPLRLGQYRPPVVIPWAVQTARR